MQSAAYSQPKTLKERISSDIKPELRKQIIKLYSQNPLERKHAAIKIGGLSKEREKSTKTGSRQFEKNSFEVI